MSVFYFKLISGDDILATIISENEHCIAVTNPLTVQEIDSTDTRVALAFFPWVPTVKLMKSKFMLPKANIIMMAEAPEEFIESYGTVVDNVQGLPSRDSSEINELFDTEEDNEEDTNSTLDAKNFH